MKRTLFLAAILPAAFGVFLLAPPAHAGDAAPPTQCEVPAFPNNGSVSQGVGIPGCEAITGLCISYHNITGPARAVHPQGGATIPPNGDCSSFDPACVVDVFPPTAPPGPSRGVHAGRVVPAGFNPGDLFTINPLCLDLPDTGFDVAPVLAAGLAALGAGIVISGVRRRLA